MLSIITRLGGVSRGSLDIRSRTSWLARAHASRRPLALRPPYVAPVLPLVARRSSNADYRSVNWVNSFVTGWPTFSRALHYPVNEGQGYYALRGFCYTPNPAGECGEQDREAQHEGRGRVLRAAGGRAESDGREELDAQSAGR